MKKYFLLICLFFPLLAIAQGPKVPATVKEAFAKLYPKAAEVKWDKESAKEYEASFTNEGIECTAAFDPKGNLLESEIAVPSSTLPSSAAELLKKNHPDHQISKVFKITDSKGKVTFEAEITKGKKTIELLFDVNGKLLKK
jgi:hypothetical protein